MCARAFVLASVSMAMKPNKPSTEASPSSSHVLWRFGQQGLSFDEAPNSLAGDHIQSDGTVEDIHIFDSKHTSAPESA